MQLPFRQRGFPWADRLVDLRLADFRWTKEAVHCNITFFMHPATLSAKLLTSLLRLGLAAR